MMINDNTLMMLDNKTITKLAIAIVVAGEFKDNGIGALTRIVLEKLDTVDSLDHFRSYGHTK